jgi:BTB/POZ domain-containing protein 7
MLLAKNPGHRVCVNIDNPELTVDIFRMMVHYLYTGDVPTIDTALDNLEILMKLGEEFGTPNVLEHDMNALLNTNKFSDVTLVFQDNFAGVTQNKELVGADSSFELQCHKGILAARSPFFHSLLTKLSKEKDLSKPLRLVLDEKIIPRQYGRVLLQCMYLDCVDVSSVIRWASGSDERSVEDPHKLLTVPEVAMEVYEIARFLEFATLEQGMYESRGRIHSYGKYTRKNAQVVTNLQQTCSNAVPTTCQQDVFALLVPSLLTSCQ